MTTKGFKEEEFRKVGTWIAEVLKNKDDEALKQKVKAEVIGLTANFPFE